MRSDPTVLAFDTSAAHCAAALLSGDRILASTCEAMSRGQAERLMPLLEELLTSAGLTWQDLSRIGVGIGPGNFTGIRISVSAARGLALGLGIPAIGVSTFEALQSEGETILAVPAPREMVYVAGTGDVPHLLPMTELPPDTLLATDGAALSRAIAQYAARRPDIPTPQRAPRPFMHGQPMLRRHVMRPR